MARIIEVVVTPSGATTVQTKGFAGSDCAEASRWLEQVLGIATTDHKTSEFFQTTPHEQQEVRA